MEARLSLFSNTKKKGTNAKNAKNGIGIGGNDRPSKTPPNTANNICFLISFCCSGVFGIPYLRNNLIISIFSFSKFCIK